MYKTLVALTFGLLSSVAVAEQMYRWVDDQGVPQFGQQPPEGKSYQRVDITASPPPGGALREPAPLPSRDANPEEDQQSEIQAKADKAAEAKRLEQCTQLQANLRTLETNPRLSRTNDAGEVERIGEDERQELIAKAKADLENYCKN
ncbi:DUF4124 domain-containing protein [Halopseudomonas laoshanensis]|uniref:DUF4124 domain-containing protein n=1 Tax=Halopseudomonas laoshanensis TaxID=2268758 RepID=A0A7V7GMM7_9GAMM|nr:DUF4124 domain-containing protein [Halopseudomonas laoshanensis]KAA0690457.1 DUF4124 domain-containing protein [Halopseudomonas laoshanensis]